MNIEKIEQYKLQLKVLTDMMKRAIAENDNSSITTISYIIVQVKRKLTSLQNEKLNEEETIEKV